VAGRRQVRPRSPVPGARCSWLTVCADGASFMQVLGRGDFQKDLDTFGADVWTGFKTLAGGFGGEKPNPSVRPNSILHLAGWLFAHAWWRPKLSALGPTIGSSLVGPSSRKGKDDAIPTWALTGIFCEPHNRARTTKVAAAILAPTGCLATHIP